MKDELKVIFRKLPNFDEIELYPVADLHWEDPNTNKDLFMKFVAYILDKPNRYIVVNGDITDDAIISSVSDIYGAEMNPGESTNQVSHILRQLIERVLAWGTGNHEGRIYKLTGIDISAIMAEKAGLSLEYYHNNSFMLFINFGGIDYSAYFQHGNGGGRQKGGKLNMVVRMTEVVDADMFTSSHVHDPMFTPLKSFKVNYELKRCEPHIQYCMISNAWQYYGGYGQTHGFRPAPNTIIYYRLDGKQKGISLHTIDL